MMPLIEWVGVWGLYVLFHHDGQVKDEGTKEKAVRIIDFTGFELSSFSSQNSSPSLVVVVVLGLFSHHDCNFKYAGTKKRAEQNLP